MEVIAGDILDHSAAALAKMSRAVDEFRADKKIAGGAIGVTKRGIDAGSDDAADGRFEIKRNGQREKLFLVVEWHGEVVEIGASVNAESEVARIVLGDLIEAGHVEGKVVANRRHADAEFGAIAAWDECEMLESGEADDFSNFFRGGRSCDG